MAINPSSKGLWEKTIQLTSGGFIRIEVVGHPLDMIEEDRTFVEQLVDHVKEYEADAKKYGAATRAESPPGSCDRHADCDGADRDAQKVTGDNADHGPEVR